MDKVEVPGWVLKALESDEAFNLILKERAEGNSLVNAYEDMVDEIRKYIPGKKFPGTYNDYYIVYKRKNKHRSRVVPKKVVEALSKDGFVNMVYSYKRQGHNMEQCYHYTVSFIKGHLPKFTPPYANARSMQESLNSKRRRK